MKVLFISLLVSLASCKLAEVEKCSACEAVASELYYKLKGVKICACLSASLSVFALLSACDSEIAFVIARCAHASSDTLRGKRSDRTFKQH
jgi:hypothetical protein